MDAAATLELARAAIDDGRTAEALAMLEAAATDLAETQTAAAAGLLVEAVSAALSVSGPDRAVAYGRRAVALAEQAGGVEERRALIRLGDALSWAGRYDDARSAWQRASAEAPGDDAEMLAERANALLRAGDPAAHAVAFRALVAARAQADPRRIVDALGLVTAAEVRAGRLKEAVGTAEDAVSVARAGSFEQVLALGLLAWPLSLLGDERRFEAVCSLAERGLADRRITAPGGLARGLLALSRGEATAAISAFESKLRELRFGPVAALTAIRPFGADIIEAYVRGGQPDKARRALAAMLPVALGSGQPRLVAPIRRAEGILLAREDSFRDALDAHAGWENRFEAARTDLAYGELLRRRRRRAEARERLAAAVAGFEHVGSVLWRARAESELRLAGQRLPARSVRAQETVEPLTRQEGEIVDLVVAGLSNRAIAERLVLSVKTVEGHLTTIYGKLGVASRAQAVAVLAGRDVPPD